MDPITDGQRLRSMFPSAGPSVRASAASWPGRPRCGALLAGHELLFHHQKALEIPTCCATSPGSGWTVDGWGVDLPGRRCGSGSRPTPTAPKKAAPQDPTRSINGRCHLAGDDRATLDAALTTAITDR